MYNWPTKLEQEVLDYKVDWRPRLRTDAIITCEFFLMSGDVNIDSSSFTVRDTTVWLSGGTVNSTIKNIVTTTSGRTLEVVVYIGIK